MMKGRFAAIISALFLFVALVAGNELTSGTIKSCPDLNGGGEITSSDAIMDGLPEGAFIVTGIFAMSNLVSHLETHPNTTITHLLISDMSSQDYDCQRNFLRELRGGQSSRTASDSESSGKSYDARNCIDLWNAKITHNAEEAKNLTRRILERASSTLESLTFLRYQETIYLSDHDHEPWDDVDGPYFDTVPLSRPDMLLEFAYPRLTSLTTYQSIPISDLGAHVQNFSALTHAQFHLRYADGDKTTKLAEIQKEIPTLKVVRLVGDVNRFLSYEYLYRHAGWGYSYVKRIVSILEELITRFSSTTSIPPRPPKTLTIIVQPYYHPFLDYTTDQIICGNPAIDYAEFFSTFGGVDRPAGPEYENVHISIPIEEDYRKHGRLLFPVERAVRYFVERVSGEGEGEWAIPERVRYSKELWWDKDYRQSKDASAHIEL